MTSVFFVLLILSSVIVPLFPQPVSAKSLNEMTLLEQAKSFAYINTLAYCIKDVGYVDGMTGDLIPNAQAKSGTWFGAHFASGGTNADLTREFGYLEGGQGDDADRINCNSLVTSASNLWGFSSPLEMLCSFAERQNGGDCLNDPRSSSFQISSTDKADAAGKFYAAIKTKIYGGDEPTLTPEIKYILYSATFFADKGCSAKPNDGSLTSGTILPEGSGISVYNVKQVVSTTPTTIKYFYTANDAEITDPNPNALAAMSAANYKYYSKEVAGTAVISATSAPYYGLPGNTNRLVYFSYKGGNVKPTCREISNVINNPSVIGAAFNYFKNHPAELAVVEAQKLCTTSPNDPSCATDKPSSSCPVEGLGWIVCPVINGLSTLNDGMWSLVSSLMKVSPLKQSDSIYNAWKVVRNIANIAFVIVFLIIIFSQLSSIGITNYGVKKMLPRLVIGAILVNVSFIIVQLAVDISNILGTGLYDVIVSQAPAVVPTWTGLITILTTSTIVTGAVAGAVFAGGAAAAFWVVLPMAAMAALGILAALLTLLFRQAVIPVLAIIAPLAFVAFLLPNTASLFKKWQSLFVSMLMLYLTAAFVFGGARFASAVMFQENEWWAYLIALLVLALPLFSLPFLAKQGGPLLSKVSGALSGLANKANKPISGWGGKQREQADKKFMSSDPSNINRFNVGKRMRMRSYRTGQVKKTQASVYEHATSEYDDAAILDGSDNNRYKKVLSPEDFQKAQNAAKERQSKRFNEEVAAAEIKQTSYSGNDRLVAATTGIVNGVPLSNADRVAAVRWVMQNGTSDDRRSIYASTHGASEEVRTSARDGFFQKQDHRVYGAGTGQQIFEGVDKTGAAFSTSSLDTAMRERVENEGMSAELLAQDTLVTEHAARIKDDITIPISDIAKTRLTDSAKLAQKSEQYSKATAATRAAIDKIAEVTTPPATTPPASPTP